VGQSRAAEPGYGRCLDVVGDFYYFCPTPLSSLPSSLLLSYPKQQLHPPSPTKNLLCLFCFFCSAGYVMGFSSLLGTGGSVGVDTVTAVGGSKAKHGTQKKKAPGLRVFSLPSTWGFLLLLLILPLRFPPQDRRRPTWRPEVRRARVLVAPLPLLCYLIIVITITITMAGRLRDTKLIH
jgi:hypothetical protein